MPKTKITQSPFPETFRLIAERDLKRVKQQLSQRLKVVKRQRAGLRKATAVAKKAKWPKDDDHSTDEENSLTPAVRDVTARRLATVAQLEWLRTVAGVAWQPSDGEPLIESLHRMGFSGAAHEMQCAVDRHIDPANPADEESVLHELLGLILAVQQDLETGLPPYEIPGFGSPLDKSRYRRDHKCREAQRRTSGSTGTNNWHSAEESPPNHLENGPLTGNKKQLATWTSPGTNAHDPRTLDRKLRDGIFWGRKNSGQSFSIWFITSASYAEANRQRLQDLHEE